MSYFSQFGAGNIKSIQRGVTDYTGSSGVTITISSVNTGKSILSNLGVAMQSGSTSTSSANSGYFEFINSTTIFFSGAPGGLSTKGAWQVVEYY